MSLPGPSFPGLSLPGPLFPGPLHPVPHLTNFDTHAVAYAGFSEPGIGGMGNGSPPAGSWAEPLRCGVEAPETECFYSVFLSYSVPLYLSHHPLPPILVPSPDPLPLSCHSLSSLARPALPLSSLFVSLPLSE